MRIEVLGPGCSRCEKTEKIVRDVVAETGSDAIVEKVTDILKIAGYGVMSTPTVVVDGEVVSIGKIPEKDEIKSWLNK